MQIFSIVELIFSFSKAQKFGYVDFIFINELFES